MRTIQILVLLLAGSSAAAESTCAPVGLLRIETVNVTPGLPAGTFAARPKILFRSGSRYARIEEAPDPGEGQHLLYVVSTPNAWLVNLADKTGEHVVDPDPDSAVHVPVFGGDVPENFPQELYDLEFGCELDFFTAHDASRIPHQTGGKSFLKHVLERTLWRVTLLTDTSGRPQALILSQDDAVIFALRYTAFELLNEINYQLFARPGGIRWHPSE